MHYPVIILLTFSENPEALKDTIDNFKFFMPGALIVVNNGPGGDLGIDDERVHILQNSYRIEYFETMTPIHLVMKDYLVANNITSDYILMMSSNQLFLRHGFEDFIRRYKGGFYRRELAGTYKSSCEHTDACKHVMDALGPDKFKYCSNHDGMFFLYKDFIDMLSLCEGYRDTHIKPHNEEFIYVAYLISLYAEEELGEFEQYNGWTWEPHASFEFYKKCLSEEKYMMKRVRRDMVDNVRRSIKMEHGY